MLLAVEGGGLFSSSASGYSRGLTLLLLGQKNEEKSMSVAPWNQYQLVDKKRNCELQLASRKKRIVCGCASFVCFGCASLGLESPSPPKVGPSKHQDILSGHPVSNEVKDQSDTIDTFRNDITTKKDHLKSSLKKTNSLPVSIGVSENEILRKRGINVPCLTERRKVQWTDLYGGELVEVRQFEISDDGGSDDEYEYGVKKTCACSIM